MILRPLNDGTKTNQMWYIMSIIGENSTKIL